jgi:hypothetical protein
MFVECGVCKGQGQVLIVRPTTGPTQVETCTNCGGNGAVLKTGSLVVTFKRSDELPPVVWNRSDACRRGDCLLCTWNHCSCRCHKAVAGDAPEAQP